MSVGGAPWVRAFVGLGSNLGDPVAQVRSAFAALAGLTQVRLTARSSLWRSPPLDRSRQPDYVNAVAALDTALGAHELLDELQRIEHEQGRVRGPERWGPRTLDLDLLLYGARLIDDPRLRVPHPGLALRAFVLLPLAELDAGLEVTGLGPLSELLARVSADDVWRIGDA